MYFQATQNEVDVYWSTFRVIAILLSFLMGVVGFFGLGSKLFGFLNAMTDFITTSVPGMLESIARIETMFQSMVSATERLGIELKDMRNDFHSHELQDVKVQAEIKSKLEELISTKG